MSQNEPVYLSLEFTPNPNTLKYLVNRVFLEKGAVQFSTVEEAEEKSDLVKKLFGIPGISAVMVGRDFITVTKNEDGDWDRVHQSASETIESSLTRGVFLDGASHQLYARDDHSAV